MHAIACCDHFNVSLNKERLMNGTKQLHDAPSYRNIFGRAFHMSLQCNANTGVYDPA